MLTLLRLPQTKRFEPVSGLADGVRCAPARTPIFSLGATRHHARAARYLAPPPRAGIKAKFFGRCAALTPLVDGARRSLPALHLSYT